MRPARIHTIISLLTCAAALVFITHAKQQAATIPVRINPLCTALFPQAGNCEFHTQPVKHYRVYPHPDTSSPATTLGYIITTTDLAVDIPGYNGPISLAIGIDQQNTIVGVQIVEHHETNEYIAPGLSAFLQQFRNQPLTTSFRLGENIDGITGATITSRAIAESVTQSCQRFTAVRDAPTAPLPLRSEHPSPQTTQIKKQLQDAGITAHPAKYWQPYTDTPR